MKNLLGRKYINFKVISYKDMTTGKEKSYKILCRPTSYKIPKTLQSFLVKINKKRTDGECC